jgi:mono/diheme cytochrome c family protein
MSMDLSRPSQSANPTALDRGETTDVVDLHAIVTRERAEPEEGMEPLSLWLVVFIAVLLFWAGSYLTQYSGGFRADEFNEGQINVKAPPVRGGGSEDPAEQLARAGAIVYANNCVACHQGDGNGTPGLFPPLTGSEWVLAEGPNRLIRIVLHGLQGPILVKGTAYNNQMNAFGPNLSDKEVAAVLTYIRNTWGNKASMVTAEEVAAVRAATDARSVAWTAEELDLVPVTGGAVADAGGDTEVGGAQPTLEQIKAVLQSLSEEERAALLESLE